MLRWAIGFMIVLGFFSIAIIATIFGFGDVAEGASSIAKILFFIFCVVFVSTLVFDGKILKKLGGYYRK